MQHDIIVLGSINMDYVINCKRLPKQGETIKGKCLTHHPGGKGANQAAAASKLGASTKFIGARGKDRIGRELSKNLKSLGVKLDLKLSNKETGSAHILVTDKGENHIVIIQGANNDIKRGDVLRSFKNNFSAKILLVQLEIPIKSVIEAVKIAEKNGLKVILDPAPAQKLPKVLLEKIDFLIPNQNELYQITESNELNDEKEQAYNLLEQGVKNVLLTRGKQGVRLYNNDGFMEIKAPEVEVVDTTGAGDAFAGAFAFGLTCNLALVEAIEIGVLYASTTVKSAGAQSSFIGYDEFLSFEPRVKSILGI